MAKRPLPDRSWRLKFNDAFRGVKRGVRGQASFFIHFFAAAAVVLAGWILNADRADWCLLLLCITLVLMAEMFNSALECAAKVIETRYNAHIRDALDIGAAAVLIASLGAAIVGTLVLGHRLGIMLDWWKA